MTFKPSHDSGYKQLVGALQQALLAPGQNELQRTLDRWLREQLRRKAPADMKPAVADALAHIPDLMEGTPMLADTMGRLFRQAIQKGRKEGLKEGRKEGRKEGWQEGRDEAYTALLTQLIEQRFDALPDWARARIQSAVHEERERWLRKALSASSLEAIFEPDDPSH